MAALRAFNLFLAGAVSVVCLLDVMRGSYGWAAFCAVAVFCELMSARPIIRAALNETFSD